MVECDKEGNLETVHVQAGRDGDGLLTLLFSPVQWTIAWLCVASPLSTNELLSRVICVSRDSSLLKRRELSSPTACSSPSVTKPDKDPLSPPPMSNVRSSTPRRFKPPLSQRTGPGTTTQAEVINRKPHRYAVAESGSSVRKNAMFCSEVALRTA